MKRIQYDRYGGPEVLYVGQYTLPDPGAHEVVVKLVAAGINPMDWKLRSGQFKSFTGSTFPRGIGSEFAGIVEEVGKDVKRFKPGDAVLGSLTMKKAGAFAQRVLAEERYLAHKPNSVLFSDAATLPIAGVTAWLALNRTVRLRQDQRLFLNGAMGSVGQAALSIAKAIGAEVTGRIGADDMERAAQQSFSRILDYANAIPSELHHTFDVVLDCHGSLSFREAEQLLRPRGRIIHIDINASKAIRSFTSFAHRILISDPVAANLEPVVALAEESKLKIPISQHIPLEQVPDAFMALERGEKMHGKIVVDI